MLETKIKKFNLKDGTYIRFCVAGVGEPLILFHTFRNRLEYFNPIIPMLSRDFTVYCLDLPGFGDSPINKKTIYDQNFFTESLVNFIKYLNLSNVTLAGESIGGVLPITVSSKIPSKIKKIYSFNPYDYDKNFAEGISRGNVFSKFILFHIGIPILGNLFSSLENKFILKKILNGGFFDGKKLSPEYLNLLISSLQKNGYTYHFRNVLSNFKTWTDCKKIYKTINTPVSLVYGEFDWSKIHERFETQSALNLDSHITLKNCGHFSFLEKPDEVAQILLDT